MVRSGGTGWGIQHWRGGAAGLKVKVNSGWPKLHTTDSWNKTKFKKIQLFCT